MATAYPSTLPLPKVEGFSVTVAAGLIKTEMPSHQAQRRVFNTMPHKFSLTFVMSVETWAVWYNWASDNGYRWFDLYLPTMYAGREFRDIAPITVRFISDLAAANISQTHVQVTVTAESAPSANYRKPSTGADLLLGVERNDYEALGLALDFTDNSAAVRR